MDDLVRLVYASKATFENSNSAQGIEWEIEQILSEARHNNATAEIGGVLFYDNGYFFQCLEGHRDAVVQTYQRVCADTRHKNPKVLLNGFTKRRLFENWSMKYLAPNENLQSFLAQHDLTVFEPYDYDREMVGRILVFFQQAKTPDDPEPVLEKPLEIPPPAPKTGWRRFFSR